MCFFLQGIVNIKVMCRSASLSRALPPTFAPTPALTPAPTPAPTTPIIGNSNSGPHQSTANIFVVDSLLIFIISALTIIVV